VTQDPARHRSVRDARDRLVLRAAFADQALELGEVLATSDVPAGVVNLLSGPREELAPHAALHMDVNALAIHGGSAQERRDLELAAAENLKRVTFLEDVPPYDWRSPDRQCPYRMAAFVE